mmetsp:Transcript_21633/g.29455  ORF Transcript_21633/g.29455 Transcript_21633/m.29455 type:complete len:121 (-) Transcript_21633:79-441(-)
MKPLRKKESTTWDQYSGHACVCDSSWPVGLGKDERQRPEYFGPDCSLRRCPSGNDPNTSPVDEENGRNVTSLGGHGKGDRGNLLVVECSNRGSCDERLGTCNCYKGYYGKACSLKDALAT